MIYSVFLVKTSAAEIIFFHYYVDMMRDSIKIAKFHMIAYDALVSPMFFVAYCDSLWVL